MSIASNFSQEIYEEVSGCPCAGIEIKPKPGDASKALIVITREMALISAQALKTKWETTKTSHIADNDLTQTAKDRIASEYDAVLSKFSI